MHTFVNKLTFVKISINVNRQATICLFRSFRKVNYYTVVKDGETQSETDQFFSKFLEDEEHLEDIQELREWIVKIGNDIGAVDGRGYFRHEKTAEALPPEFVGIKIRLYCYRLSTQIVILFNGGVKTAATAQECPNVAPHFRLANQVARQLQRLRNDGMIEMNGKNLENLEELIFDI